MLSIPKAIVKSGYKAQSDDTSVDADVLIFNLLRRLSFEDKAERVQKIDWAIRQIWIASAEDIILQKLAWRRNSDLEKQWRDVLGVLKLQGERLDFGYLEQWAQTLNLWRI